MPIASDKSKDEPSFLTSAGARLTVIFLVGTVLPLFFMAERTLSFASEIEKSPNTWLHENFVVIKDREIIAYFEANWCKPLNIISNFRLIIFNKKKGFIVTRAIFDYFEYLFVARGCKAFNWFVATKNLHARRVYEKFVKKYFGHLVGKRHCGQMAYNGEVSDIYLYEVTCEEYFEWKEKSGK